MDDDKPMTVGDALQLSNQTKKLLERAEQALQKLTDAGVRKPAILSTLVEPTLKIRDTLNSEVEALERLVKDLAAER